MKITVSEFGGMAPKIDPALLAEKLAVTAVNTGFESGALAPVSIGVVPSIEFSGLPESTMSVLRPAHDGTRLAFSTQTTGEAFASMMAPSDKWGRVYYTTSLGPRFTVRDNYIAGGLKVDPVSYKLGMKQPLYQVVVGTPAYTLKAGESADLVRVAYIFTFVDAYGHESAPSNPSTIAEIPTNVAFSTALSFTAESLPDTNVAGAVRRIYRAAFDGSVSTWQFLADIPLALGAWSDTIPFGQEGEALISADWVPPPVLAQMVPMASNFAAGFIGNLLCYSEQRLPHAWPEAYRFTLKYQIVGLKPTQNGLLVATNGKPYWAFGADPASAVPVELDANLPCMSAKSLVDMGGYVVYASQDGLVAVSGQEAKVITGEFVDRRVWLRDFNPPGLVAFAHEGLYVFGHGTKWWAFDPAAPEGLVELTGLGVTPTTLRQAYYDAKRDTTVLLDNLGVASDVLSMVGVDYQWRSKEFATPPVSFGVAQVIADTYPVTLRVLAGGQTQAYSVADDRPLRLRSGFRAERWQIELAGAARVRRATICQAPQELING